MKNLAIALALSAIAGSAIAADQRVHGVGLAKEFIA